MSGENLHACISVGVHSGEQLRFQKKKKDEETEDMKERQTEQRTAECLKKSERSTVSISLNRNTQQPIMVWCLGINHLTGPFSKHYPVKPNLTYFCLLSPPIPQRTPSPRFHGEQSRLPPQARAGEHKSKVTAQP